MRVVCCVLCVVCCVLCVVCCVLCVVCCVQCVMCVVLCVVCCMLCVVCCVVRPAALISSQLQDLLLKVAESPKLIPDPGLANKSGPKR